MSLLQLLLMEKNRLIELLQAYLSNTLSSEQGAELAALLEQPANQQAFGDLLYQQLADKELNIDDPDEKSFENIRARLLRQMQKEETAPVKGAVSLWRRPLRYAAAVLILAVAAAATYLLWNPAPPPALAGQEAIRQEGDIAPGSNKAELTLSDGTTINLDDTGEGAIAQQGNTSIVKLSNGKIVYNTGSSSGQTIMMNTMRTPRGGHYQVTLPDGSRVWLNAASSLTYPTAFAGSTRKVSITGEAYFEVAKNQKIPFIININGDIEVEVLGTSFNIDSYADEPSVRTTLVQGAVRIHTGGNTKDLRPGQQLMVDRVSGSQRIITPDVQQVIAWKDGAFNFHQMKLESVMRQLSRWYDVEVTYPNGIPDVMFGGKVQKNLPLSAMLEGLEIMNVHFTIEGRTLTIMK